MQVKSAVDDGRGPKLLRTCASRLASSSPRCMFSADMVGSWTPPEPGRALCGLLPQQQQQQHVVALSPVYAGALPGLPDQPTNHRIDGESTKQMI